MKSQTLVAALLLGLVVVVQSSPAKLDEVYEQRESRSNLNDDDDDDDEKRPYSFAYEASRHYHGAPDREHREERGEDGITRGVYRYVDPSLRVHEVIYSADENGFHVQSDNAPEYTEAQIAARANHAQLFQQIADEHNKIGAEHALEAAERGYDPQQEERYVAPQRNLDYSTGILDPASLPQFSPVVERARFRHQELFEKIADQHARIAAERKTDPRAEETGEPYE